MTRGTNRNIHTARPPKEIYIYRKFWHKPTLEQIQCVNVKKKKVPYSQNFNSPLGGMWAHAISNPYRSAISLFSSDTQGNNHALILQGFVSMAIDSPTILPHIYATHTLSLSLTHTHTHIHIYKGVPSLWHNSLLKFPKEKQTKQAEIQKVETGREGSVLQETNQEENVRIDTASYPATPHTHTESREPWEMSERRNKKGDREGDGNYLSSSAVQLEYRKSEPVTEKLMWGW